MAPSKGPLVPVEKIKQMCELFCWTLEGSCGEGIAQAKAGYEDISGQPEGGKSENGTVGRGVRISALIAFKSHDQF